MLRVFHINVDAPLPLPFSSFHHPVTKKEEHPECFQVPCLTPPLEDPVRLLRGTV
jgi:hypothetical protein